MFTHKTFELQDLQTKNIDGKRFYVTPDDEYYPSITTVLSPRKSKGLKEWRDRVGPQVASYISRTAARRGTQVHSICEDFLNNKSIEHHKENFLAWCLFNQLKETLTGRINNIHAQECALYSTKYRVAGRVDCIAEYNNELSIIDFKTSRSSRNDEYNLDYYLQASAYAEMWEERTGQPINQIVILVVTENGEVQEFVKDKTEYIPQLLQAIDDFTVQWEKEKV